MFSYYYVGNCVNSFDEQGECVLSQLPYSHSSEFAMADEEAKLIPQNVFNSVINVPGPIKQTINGHAVSYMVDEKNDVYMLYDRTADIHYFFVKDHSITEGIYFPKPPKAIQELLDNIDEAQYPSQFDLSHFKTLTSFHQRVLYCNSTLKKIGNGSSRIVYEIDEFTALKLAKNSKGLIQNSREASEYINRNYDHLISKVLEHHPDYLWVESEKAVRIGKERFEQLAGLSFDLFEKGVSNESQAKRGMPMSMRRNITDQERDILDDNEFYYDIVNFMLDTDALAGDLTRISSFGEINGRLVLLDYGLDQENFQNSYNKKRKIGVYEGEEDDGLSRHFPKLGMSSEDALDLISWHDSYKDLYPGYSGEDRPYGDDYYFQSKESAYENVNDVMDFFESLPSPITLYRSIFVNSMEEISYEHGLGESWSYNKDSALNFAKNQNRGNVLLTAQATSDDVDWKRTVDLHFEFSQSYDGYDEDEIHVKNPENLFNVRAEWIVKKKKG